jgi:AcrR family transcriptional regulator
LQDRREVILKAAIATLREYGYSGFTQPRVAKRADVRQSHLTYYFPTRLALLEGVARLAAAAEASDLASPVTSCPAASSSSTVAEPIHPEAPVTKTRMACLPSAPPRTERLIRDVSD